MAKLKSKISQAQRQNTKQDTLPNVLQSSESQDTLTHTLQCNPQEFSKTAASEMSVVGRIAPRYPSWPTSKPGPQSTLPVVGMHSINPFRPEQVAEMAYHQETSEPLVNSSQRSVPDASIHSSPTSFDQPRNAHEILGKRKQRL
jgi:hypothetical protein